MTSTSPDRSAATAGAIDRRQWATQLAKGLLIWIVPVIAAWLLLTSIYNPFLTKATENLVRLSESPSVTRLLTHDTHHFVVTRTDVPPPNKGFLSSVRVTDTHFPLIMTGLLFLAVPAVPLRRRLESLGWATLISVFFHIVSLFLWVKFIYATQLGAWSAENYSIFQQNFWGLSKHLADLPFKFAMPLILWSAFFLGELVQGSEPRPSRSHRQKKRRA